MEKRIAERIKVDMFVRIIFNHRNMLCKVKNISEKGALLSIEDTEYSPETIQKHEIGTEVWIAFTSEKSKMIKAKAKIMRVDSVGDEKQIAIVFSKYAPVVE